jgi:hypothetical protein
MCSPTLRCIGRIVSDAKRRTIRSQLSVVHGQLQDATDNSQRLLQIRNNIGRILDADREPDQAG